MPDILVSDQPDAALHQAVEKGLMQFNTERSGGNDYRPLNVALKEAGEFCGGLIGQTYLGWLYVRLIFIEEPFRKRGYGSKIMRAAETEAIARGCRGVWLDTYSFQARGFYEKLGYSVFGKLEDYPPGGARYFMQKRFVVAAA